MLVTMAINSYRLQRWATVDILRLDRRFLNWTISGGRWSWQICLLALVQSKNIWSNIWIYLLSNYSTYIYILLVGLLFLFRPANVEKCFLTFTYVISLYQFSAFAALMQLYVIPIFSTSICYTVVKWSPLLLLPIAGNEIICLTIFSYRLLFCLQLG